MLLSFRKKRDYLLRPASLFYAFAGRMGEMTSQGGDDVAGWEMTPEGGGQHRGVGDYVTGWGCGFG